MPETLPTTASAEPSLADLTGADEGRYLLPVYPHMPFEPVRGQGVYLETRDGRKLIDFYGGHAVALLGYAHPRLLERLGAQAAELFFQSNVVPLAVRARAAKRLLDFGPEGFSRVFFVNSGAEANENALRLAFRTTGKTRVVALEGAFHGRTAAAAAITDKSASWYGFPQAPFPVTVVPRGDLGALETALAADAAAFIAEPVQGNAGAYALGADYLKGARELTKKAGAFLIFDEVQCGLGRTGQPFAAQTYGVLPDVLTTAKGLAGGYPVGALLTTEGVAAGLKMGDLGTTFGGGPIACALVEAVIEVIEEEGLLARVRELSAVLRRDCVVGPVTDIQGEGFLLGLRTESAKELQAALLARGIVTGTSSDPKIVRLLPPLVLERQHVDALAQALRDIAAAGAGGGK
jgi:acetylornithine/N-succinyldiaminopimelate aminotransferase